MEVLIPRAERRKQVRLRMRPDLIATPQRYEGRLCHVVKDPVSLKYYRFNDQEYFVFQLLDGKHTLEDVQKQFEAEFRPHRLTLEDLEGFARQLVTSGLVQHESASAGKHLFERRRKQKLTKKLASFTNILYIKIPIFDPDRILNWMYKYLSWMFTYWFLFLSVGFMLSAVTLVTLKFDVFWDKLPAYNEFFHFRTVLYMWIALGVVKVIHEFGHGLSCKAFGGECHEMGALLMCFSPALYCNVTDSWTLADKWKRIIISFAGIYVELMMAALATFVWWYTPQFPFINNVALCIMVLCSISTFVFNANPLMRFDGYYMLADWLEVPNLRERANRFLSHTVQEKCLGIEVPPEQYMAFRRKVLFITYAILAWIYRWIVTFGILAFLWNWLTPYKLESISMMLTFAAVFSMVFWPMFKLVKNIRQRGRLPDMKRKRVIISLTILGGVIIAFFFAPLPVSRIREQGVLQIAEKNIERVYLPDSGFLDSMEVRDGQFVRKGQVLARFSNPKMKSELAEIEAEIEEVRGQINAITNQLPSLSKDQSLRRSYEGQLSEYGKKLDSLQTKFANMRRRLDELSEIRAPRDGTVMTPPKRDDLHRFWDKAEAPALCSIGDISMLRVLVPVDPQNYRLVQENLMKYGELPVSIHLPGRSDRVFVGRVTRLPETPAVDVPLPLTHRGGGTLATKPNQNPNINEPLVQTYLLPIELVDNDSTFCPGVIVTVKIHNEWRSLSWWCWEKLASALNWGVL
jgi:putative peptide zinc metalloprotease protein